VLIDFQFGSSTTLRFPFFLFTYYGSVGGFCLNQERIEAAAVHMRLFLVGLSFAFDANFHELEEVVKWAMLEIELEEGKH
jgi:hypothetical protein